MKYFTLAIAFLVVFGGCSSDKKPENDKQSNSKTSISNTTVTVGTSKKSDEISPAQNTSGSLSESSSPEEVCRILHDGISNDDRLTWQKCLSKVAARNFHTANIELTLPGGEQAAYSILSTVFATSKKEIALVQCVVQDMVGGKLETSNFSWLMRIEAAGWRVTGMSLTMDEDGNSDLLSFENPQDIAQMKSWAGSPEVVAENNTDSNFK